MKKKDAKVCLAEYRQWIDEIRAFVAEAEGKKLSASALRGCFDHAVIEAHRCFEHFILSVCVTRINRDPTALYDEIGVKFGKHITVAQCEYLLVGDRYFDFRGHSGLADVIAKAAGRDSPMHKAAKVADHRQAFEILAGLRNWIAHESTQSWGPALKAMQHWEPGRKNLGSAGAWLMAKSKGQARLERLLVEVDRLCESLANAA